MLLEAS